MDKAVKPELKLKRLLNTHHVHNNKDSGHRIASQEDTQSDAEMYTFYLSLWDHISLIITESSGEGKK